MFVAWNFIFDLLSSFFHHENVAGKGLSLQAERGDFSLQALMGGSTGSVQQTHREGVTQTIVNLMFINMLVVYSLPILLKREESTRFLSGSQGRGRRMDAKQIF